jgi:hypothetical protein
MSGSTFDYYDHRFTQFRTDGIARSNLTIVAGSDDYYANYYKANLRVDPDTCVTRGAVSTILEFSLKNAEYYTNVSFVIPS